MIRLNKLKIYINNNVIWIYSDDICYCKADRCYSSIIHNTGKIYMMSIPLKKLMTKLPESFFRCHRSYLVNIRKIRYIDIQKRIIYQELYQIPVSETKITELLSKWPVRILVKE